MQHWVLVQVTIMADAKVFGRVDRRDSVPGMPGIASCFAGVVDLLLVVVQHHVVSDKPHFELV